MFDWFRQKRSPLQFNDNAAAFVYACSLGYPLLLEARIPALVIAEGRPGREGEHWYRLQLAGPKGVVGIWGGTLTDAPGFPETGDLVAFRIVRIATELPEDASLIGYIACRLKPILHDEKGWQIDANFTPTIKPELHL